MFRHVLIAGATGIVGRALARHLATQPGWQVTGCARRVPQSALKIGWLELDLSNTQAVSTALHSRNITHVFYCGRADYTQATKEPIAENVAMLRNVLDAVESAPLQHVHIVQGSKVYGSDLGAYKTPAQESDPRVTETNWYYQQEDLLAARSKGQQWHWSASRPHGVCDADVSAVRGLARVIAVYATIMKALGEPLYFPGSDAAFHALYQSVDSVRFNFNRGYDVASSTIKLRQSGFTECADTGEMFRHHLARFREQRLIP